jgi:hypothetical protein
LEVSFWPGSVVNGKRQLVDLDSGVQLHADLVAAHAQAILLSLTF